MSIPLPVGARKAIVILGMHRSGTSALCGALDLLGVDFGKQLMPATGANEKGHWENEEIVRAHERLLSSLGSFWDDDDLLPFDWVEREGTREIPCRAGRKRYARLQAIALNVYETIRKLVLGALTML